MEIASPVGMNYPDFPDSSNRAQSANDFFLPVKTCEQEKLACTQ